MVNKMVKVSTSILSIKDNLIDNIKKLNETDTDFIHYDVMDGNFVSDRQFTINEIIDIINKSSKKIDIHLMVENPDIYIENFLKSFLAFLSLSIYFLLYILLSI